MNSYAKIESRKVMDACELCLASIQNSMDKDIEDFIDDQMSGWFFPSKTREIAIARLEAASALSDYNLTLHKSKYLKSLVDDLHKLARHSDYVRVSSDDISLIGKYLDRT